MKKVLLVSCLLFITIKAFSQRFSQYNTGTLYDSFENPSQRSFIPDSSRQFASNFFVPNFSGNVFLSGEGQSALKSRIFTGIYNTTGLTTGNDRYNYLNANGSDYILMLKVYTNPTGNRELGFFIKTNFEAKSIISNETLALFGGSDKFANNIYDDAFNDRYYSQVYHQIGVTFREQVTPRLALGVKFSLLSGVDFQKYSIFNSQLSLDKPNNMATFSLSGIKYTGGLGNTSTIVQGMGLAFTNPGASISLGATYKNEDAYNFQFNIKDLGFIHWSNKISKVSYFSRDTAQISMSPTFASENTVSDKLSTITGGNEVNRGFYFPINGLAEVSVNKDYWLDYERSVKFSPTVIISKELFYQGLTGALVAPVQYEKYVVTLSSYYNDLKMFGVGGQFMIKTPNSEFFIGSDALYQSVRFAKDAIQGSNYVTPAVPGRYSGTSFFIGFSLKFGNLIESPMDASYVPNGEKGFLGRLYEKIFKKDKNY
ncbi:MAG: DUF5723 family protein [Mucilaginibacter sp.]